jgi:hypothetical protein
LLGFQIGAILGVKEWMAYQRQLAYEQYQRQMAYQQQMAQQSALQRLPFSQELIENPYIREGRGGWRADRYNRYMQSNKNWDAGVAQDIFDMVSGDYDLQRELRASLPETFNPKEAADWAGVAVHALPIITNAIDKCKFDKGSWNETLNLALPMIIGAISNN